MDVPLGLIAGGGEFSLEVARAVRSRGRRVHAIGFHAVTPPTLDAFVDRIDWLYLGELERLRDRFRSTGVSDVVMAGKVDKRHLFVEPEAHRADATALSLVGRLRDRQDDSILGVLADWLESEGLRLRPQGEMAPELLAPAGQLGDVVPTERAMGDLAFGWPIAESVAALGLGQCIVVNEKAVVAVEAMEGTDETILRAGRLAGPGATVIKLPRPGQDTRYDLPAIGAGTVAAMAEAEAEQLVYAAGRTVLLERDRLIEAAERVGIGLFGHEAEARSGERDRRR